MSTQLQQQARGTYLTRVACKGVWLLPAFGSAAQQGPCLDAAYEQHTVRVTNMATEDRWPLFAQRASDAGAASMLSLQLFVESDNLGALYLHARTPDAFTDESEQVGLLFAAHAVVATPVSGRRPSSARP